MNNTTIAKAINERLSATLKSFLDPFNIERKYIEKLHDEIIRCIQSVEIVADKARSEMLKQYLSKYCSKEINEFLKNLNDIDLSTEPENMNNVMCFDDPVETREQ